VVVAVMTDGAGVLDDYNFSHLLVTSVDNRLDLLAEVVYMDKAIMKAMFLIQQLIPITHKSAQ